MYKISDMPPKNVKFVDKKSAEKLKKDPFFIKDLTITADILYVIGSYTGGCHSNHLFDLMFLDEFLGNNGTEIEGILIHDNQGDNCKKIVRQDLAFNLLPLKKKYKEGKNSTTLQLTMIVMNKKLIYKIT